MRALVAVVTHAPAHNVSVAAQLDTHIPLEHAWPAKHGAPHAPQLLGLVCTSTHAEPQRVSPGWQTHWPAPQVSSAPQEKPHAPQLVRSVWRLAQPEGHTCWPPVHLFPVPERQAPPEQTLFAPQEALHAPQLALLVLRSTQPPLHSVRPGGQVQAAPTQVWGSVHALPHAPQLALSTSVSTQVVPPSPHEVEPIGQVHIAPTQLLPPVQTLVQLPQWVESDAGLMQTPPHASRFEPQPQMPLAHSSPAAQVFPHMPQFIVSVAKLTHAPEQLFCPVGHTAVHAEAAQTPPSHAAPHAPQLPGLLVRSKQPASHPLVPEGHPHAPF